MEYRFYLYHQERGYVRIKDPVGWDSMGKTMKRFGMDNAIGQKWHGIFQDFTAQKLQFIKDAKAFLQYYYERDGVEALVHCKVERRNATTRKFEPYYEGKVNFTTYKITTIAVEVNLENTGFLQKLKNRMDVKVNLESLVSQGGRAITPFEKETVDVEMHSKTIVLSAKSVREEASFTDSNPGTFTVNYLPALVDSINENVGELFTFPDQFDNSDFEDDLKFTFRPKFRGTLRALKKWKFKYRFRLISPSGTPASTVNVRAYAKLVQRKVLSGGGLEDHTLLFEAFNEDLIWPACSGPPEAECIENFDTGWINVLYNLTGIDTDINDEFYVYFKFVTDAAVIDPEVQFDLTADNYVNFEIATEFPATTSKTILIHEAWTRVLQSITDTADPFRSEYFGRTDSEPVTYDADGGGSLRAYTNGNQLRLLDLPIYCSLKDLIEATAAIDGIGIGIEKTNGVERVRVEPMTYFYKATRTLRLDYVKDIEKEVLDQLYFNQLEAGIDKWRTSTGNVNNLDEFVARKEFTLPITQLKSMLSLKSPIITSGYMIEFARRASAEPTKDTDRDNDGYFIVLRRDGDNLVPAKDEAFTSVTGVISPETAYNLELSPGRCIRRNGRLLRAGLEKYKDQYIKFSFGEANNAMVTQKTGEDAITENADILISTLDSPLFLGEVYNIRAKLTSDQLEALNTTDPDAAANVFGYIEFSDTSKNHKRGYLLEARPAADSNEVNLKLIRANV
jgi:hypothetical protein